MSKREEEEEEEKETESEGILRGTWSKQAHEPSEVVGLTVFLELCQQPLIGVAEYVGNKVNHHLWVIREKDEGKGRMENEMVSLLKGKRRCVRTSWKHSIATSE